MQTIEKIQSALLLFVSTIFLIALVCHSFITKNKLYVRVAICMIWREQQQQVSEKKNPNRIATAVSINRMISEIE